MKNKVRSVDFQGLLVLLGSRYCLASKRFFGSFAVSKTLIDFLMLLLVPRLRYRPSLGIRLTRGRFNEALVIVAHIYMRGNTLFPFIFAKVSGVFTLALKSCSLMRKFAVMWFGYLMYLPLNLVVRCGSFLCWNLTSCSRLIPPIVRMAITERVCERGGYQRTEWLPFHYQALFLLRWQHPRWTGHILKTCGHLVDYISNSQPRAWQTHVSRGVQGNDDSKFLGTEISEKLKRWPYRATDSRWKRDQGQTEALVICLDESTISA